MRVAHLAMGGLQERSEVRANNIANAETPEFRATTVDFESALRSAIDRDDPNSMGSPGRLVRNTLPDVHGNTVDLQTEMVEMLEDGVRFQTMVSTYNYKVNTIRSAIGRG
jgi:flagellar basal-body rod protein FlgB